MVMVKFFGYFMTSCIAVAVYSQRREPRRLIFFDSLALWYRAKQNRGRTRQSVDRVCITEAHLIDPEGILLDGYIAEAVTCAEDQSVVRHVGQLVGEIRRRREAWRPSNEELVA